MDNDRQIIAVLVEQHGIVGRDEAVGGVADDRRPRVLRDERSHDQLIGGLVLQIIAHMPQTR